MENILPITKSKLSWSRGYAMLRLVAIMTLLQGTRAQLGVTICSCLPAFMTFQINFGQVCDGNINPSLRSGIIDRSCEVANVVDGNPGNNDYTPVSVSKIQISELGANQVILGITTFQGRFFNGDKVNYTSVTSNSNLTQPVEGLQMTVDARNAKGDDIINQWIILFGKNCNIFPLLKVGDEIGWSKFVFVSNPSVLYCPKSAVSTAPVRATAAPVTQKPVTKSPATSPVTKAPVTKAPATKAPATKAPATTPATKSPATKAPATKAPATKAPATKGPNSIRAPTQGPTKAPATNQPSVACPTGELPSTKGSKSGKGSKSSKSSKGSKGSKGSKSSKESKSAKSLEHDHKKEDDEKSDRGKKLTKPVPVNETRLLYGTLYLTRKSREPKDGKNHKASKSKSPKGSKSGKSAKSGKAGKAGKAGKNGKSAAPTLCPEITVKKAVKGTKNNRGKKLAVKGSKSSKSKGPKSEKSEKSAKSSNDVTTLKSRAGVTQSPENEKLGSPEQGTIADRKKDKDFRNMEKVESSKPPVSNKESRNVDKVESSKPPVLKKSLPPSGILPTSKPTLPSLKTLPIQPNVPNPSSAPIHAATVAQQSNVSRAKPLKLR